MGVGSMALLRDLALQCDVQFNSSSRGFYRGEKGKAVVVESTGTETSRKSHPSPPIPSLQAVGDRHWCHPGPFPRAPGASALPAPRGSRDLPPAHGVETLVWVVSKRVTLERSAQDTPEVGKVPGTSALLCAQPLGPQQAGRRGARFGGATPNPAAPHTVLQRAMGWMSWSIRTVPCES